MKILHALQPLTFTLMKKEKNTTSRDQTSRCQRQFNSQFFVRGKNMVLTVPLDQA